MGNDEHAGGRASAFFHLLSATDIGVTQRSLHGASRASHLQEATSLSGKCKESSAGTPGTFSLSGLVYVCVIDMAGVDLAIGVTTMILDRRNVSWSYELVHRYSRDI